jgi:hypothetical protein
VGEARAVKQFLRQGTPPVFTAEAPEIVLAALDSSPLSPEELSARVAQALHRQHRIEQDLHAWLDAHEQKKRWSAGPRRLVRHMDRGRGKSN